MSVQRGYVGAFQDKILTFLFLLKVTTTTTCLLLLILDIRDEVLPRKAVGKEKARVTEGRGQTHWSGRSEGPMKTTDRLKLVMGSKWRL